mmetsp:Transcript_4121/g.13035  ORF Transcript_4121/g.13035 Transcript_4121/m.13035 type:complete len:280 (-) Transcript_4121:109-948(-)
MERAQLQQEWALGRFQERTTTQDVHGEAAALQRLYGAGFATSAGAGAPSLRRADSNDMIEADRAGDCEAIDWAGNLVAPRRRRAAAPTAARSNLTVNGGFLVGNGPEPESGAIPRRTKGPAGAAAAGFRDARFESSEGVHQSCPGGLVPSQWKTNAQLMQERLSGSLERRGGGRRAAPANPGAASAATASAAGSQAASARSQLPNSLRSRQAQLRDPSSADLVKVIDTNSIAKSLKRAGAFVKSAPSSDAVASGDRTLLTDNFPGAVPGCTYHRPRHLF